MRLLSLITKSSVFIDDLYHRYPRLSDEDFGHQQKILEDETIGGSEIWSAGLLPYGYQSKRVFVNVPMLQKQWAQENDLAAGDTDWMGKIAFNQIKSYQPELIFISNFSTFPAEFVRYLRNEISSIRFVIGWCGSPHKFQPIFREYDFILSSIPDIVESMITNGYCCYRLNHAFDPKVLTKINQTHVRSINFSFVGSIIKAPGYHYEREKLLIELSQATELEIWSPVERPSLLKRMKRRASQGLYDLLEPIITSDRHCIDHTMVRSLRNRMSLIARPRSYVDRTIMKRCHPAVFGIPMFQLLRDSKLTLNTHGDNSPASAANMRLFEATGVGTCLLTDWKENLADLFEPDVEVVTYRNAAECIHKVQHLLENDYERNSIAEAGQKRTLSCHTIYHRAEELDQIIRKHLKGKTVRPTIFG